jgi:hypothetical protein
VQSSQDISEIKTGVDSAGERISELRLSMQTVESQSSQYYSAIQSYMQDLHKKLDNRDVEFEKQEQSRTLSPIFASRQTID